MFNATIRNDTSFPLTQTILWDHKPIGPSSWIHISQYRNPIVIFEEKALRLAHHFTEQSEDGVYSCFFIGIANVDTDGEGITVTVDQFISKDAGNSASDFPAMPGNIILPCCLKKNDAKPQSSLSDYTAMMREVLKQCAAKGRVDLSLLLSMRVFASYHDNRTSFMFHMDTDMMLPTTRLRVTPINPVPILATALTRNLCTPMMNLSSVQGQPKTGYLTMDGARHLLLILESDPKASTLPLIGIWIAGLSSVQHPFVWAAGIRYIMNSTLLEKMCKPPEPFLLVLYSPQRSVPEFFECVASDGASHQPVCLLTHHDVFQLSKETTGRMTTPVEVELNLVENGPRRDLLDAALQQCTSLIEPTSQWPGLRETGNDNWSDEIMPRSIPAPFKPQMLPTSFKPSVPDVTIIFDAHDSHQSTNGSSSGHQVIGKGSNGTLTAGMHHTSEALRKMPIHQNGSSAGHVGVYCVPPHTAVSGRCQQQAMTMATINGQAVKVRQNIPLGPYAPRTDLPQNGSAMAVSMAQQVNAPQAGRFDPPVSQMRNSHDYHLIDNTMAHMSKQRLDHMHSSASRNPRANAQLVGSGGANLMMQPPRGYPIQPSQQPTVMPQYGMMAEQQQYVQSAPIIDNQSTVHQTNEPNGHQLSHTINGRMIYGEILQQQQQQNGLSQVPEQQYSYDRGVVNIHQQQAMIPDQSRAIRQPVAPHQQSTNNGYVPHRYGTQVRLMQQGHARDPRAVPQRNIGQHAVTVDSKLSGCTFQGSAPVSVALSQNLSTVAVTEHQLVNGSMPVYGNATVPVTSVAPISVSHTSPQPAASGQMPSSSNVPADGSLSPQVIQLLQQQEEQLRLLREQVSMLLSKQNAAEGANVASKAEDSRLSDSSKREPPKDNANDRREMVDVAIGANEDSFSGKDRMLNKDISSRHNCSKAVNTSMWLNSLPTTHVKRHSKHRHHRRETAINGNQSNSSVREHRKSRRSYDDELSYAFCATNEEGSTTDDVSGEVDENCDNDASSDVLSLSQSQIEMKVNNNNNDVSVASEIIVDMPAASLSPEKSGNRSSSGYGGTEDSNRSPALEESASMCLAAEQDEADTAAHERSYGRELISSDSHGAADLLFTDQKRYYQNMLSSLQKMLSQQQQAAPGSVSEIEVNRLRQLASDAEQCLRDSDVRTMNDTMEVMKRTKERITDMLGGLDISALAAAEDNTLRYEPSLLLEPVYLPKVNYMSMYFDRSSDVSMEADTISLKYLSDEQLTAGARSLQRLPHPVSVTREQPPAAAKKPEAEKTLYGSGPSMSFASCRYLEKYGLSSQAAKSTGGSYKPTETKVSEAFEYEGHVQPDEDLSVSANLNDVWRMLMEQKRNGSFSHRLPDETFSEPTSRVADTHRTPESNSANASSLDVGGNGQPDKTARPLFNHSDGDSFHVLAKNTSTPAGRPATVARQFEFTPPRPVNVPVNVNSDSGQHSWGMAKQQVEKIDNNASSSSTRRRSGAASDETSTKSSMPDRILDVERLKELPKLL